MYWGWCPSLIHCIVALYDWLPLYYWNPSPLIVLFDVFAIVLLICHWGYMPISLYDLLCIIGYNCPSIASLYYYWKSCQNVWAERLKGTSPISIFALYHIVLLNWCTIVSFRLSYLQVSLSTQFSISELCYTVLLNVCKDQLAQECCQAYGKGVSWYYPTWFKSHWII